MVPIVKAVIALLLFVAIGYGIFALLEPKQEPIEEERHVAWGLYAVGGPEEIKEIEEKIGRKTDIAATFIGFWDAFPEEFVSKVRDASTTPLIFSETAEGTTLKDVINGLYDEELKEFATQAKQAGIEIILVPFNEPNLNEFPWGFGNSPDNTAANFKAAWRHVYNIIHPVAPNVKFGIAYNHVPVPDVPENSFALLYPGSEYVDYVGIDGFNWQEDGVWQTFTEVMGSSTEELLPFGKPIYIFSTGTGEDENGDTTLKAAWIREMFAWIKERPYIQGVLWFHEDKTQLGEKDWRIDSSPQALEAFKEGFKK